MANTRRLVLAKASHPRTNRRGRLVPLRGIRIRVQFPQTRRPPVPFKRQELAYGSKPPGGGWYRRAARCAPGTAIGPGSKFRPDRCRRLLRPLRRGTPLASLARQPYIRARRITGACPLRDARPGTCKEKKRPGAVPWHRSASFGLSMDTLLSRALQRAGLLAALCFNFTPKASALRSRICRNIPADPSRAAGGGIRLRGSVSATASFRPVLSSAKKELGRQVPPSKSRFAGSVMAHRGLAPRHPPSVRPQNSGPTAVGCRGAIRKMLRHPHRRARRAALINAVSPHQFSPFGNPLSRSPLQTRTRQRGKTAGGNSAASLPARLKKPRGPSPPAEPRPAALRVDRATPPLIPLAPLPPGAGRQVRPPCGSRAHHHSSPPRCSQAHPAWRLRLSPLAPYHPRWGWAHWFCGGARPRAEERLQNNAGEIP